MSSNIPKLRTGAVIAAVSLFLTHSVLAAPRYESGLLSTNQPAAATWRSVTFASSFTVPPVVVLGPATFNDTQGLAPRVRNVTATGFEYQLDEWDYLDGTHGVESLSYLALEPGVHQIGGLTWQAGRVSAVSKTAQTATFGSAFTAPPVVLTQVEGVINSKALVSRIRLVTATNFEIRLQTQESDTAAISGESVGYIAIAPGTGTLDGAPFLVARTGVNITQAWSALAFGGTYRQPIFIAQSQTQGGADPFGIRRRNLSDTGIEISLQEEQSADVETTHAAEDVGYLVLGETQGELRAKLGVGTLQVAQPVAASWTSVSFAESYANPVVVFGPLSQGNAEPATIRVRNVTNTGFDYQIDEWDYQDGVHPTESVSYLVAEAGSYVIGGKRWQFGKATSVTHNVFSTTFAAPFAAAPVVFAQVATANGPSAVTKRISGVSANGFTLQLQEEEAADGTHAGEEVHFVAIEKGNGRLIADQLIFEAGSTPANVTGAFSTASLTRKFAAPAIFADSQTKNDAETIVARYRNPGVSSVDLRFQEEQSAAQETTHGAESAAYLLLATEVDLDEDGIADAWETTHGLDPNNPNDAALDPDNDGISNVNEYRYGTSPALFDSGGSVSVEVVTPDAFEKEGTAARFRISRTGGTVPVTVFYSLGGRATQPGLANADYQTKSPGGTTLAGSVTIGFNAASADILIEPVVDAFNEYPENASITLSGSSKYTIAGTGGGSANINDAAATPGNEQLFVAFLAPGSGVQSYASGFATLYLNGPKNAARATLSFSGLTSNQTNAYIRYGIPSGVGPELRPTLPIGQVSNEPWSIIPVGALSGQEIVDALFQAGGHYVYVNVGTGSFPAGEISGTVSRQTVTVEVRNSIITGMWLPRRPGTATMPS
ncbi:MAG: H-type lectin domain-containing protein [Verrucomicrobiota bacterium]